MRFFIRQLCKPPFKKIATVDAPSWKNLAANFRLAQRLLRFQVTNIIPLSNKDLFVTFDKSVGIVREWKVSNIKRSDSSVPRSAGGLCD